MGGPLSHRLSSVAGMTTEPRLRHICEVCNRTEILTPAAAFEAGWDYPPRMGAYGVVSPRTCGDCGMAGTVWAAVAMQGKGPDDLTDAQRATLARIAGEPESIMVADDEC
jgi:hypothetical protein